VPSPAVDSGDFEGIVSTSVTKVEAFLTRNAERFLWMLFGLLCLRFLAVDVFPTITNDSIGYLSHSDNLAEAGTIRAGYRQVGYPLYLALVDWLGGVMRVEPLLLTAVIQRGLLLAGLGYATWLWRFWALPLVFVLTTPTLIAYTNLILTEGLAVPLTVLYACLVGHTTLVSKKADEDVRLEAAWLAAGAGALYVILVSIRFHYILLGTGILGCAFVLYRNGRRARGWAIRLTTAVALFGVGLLGVMSYENSTEYDTFLPSVRGERSAYWATWWVVFDDPAVRSDPDLQDLYADGDPYAVIREVESGSDYTEQREDFNMAIGRLVEASGSTRNAQRMRSFLGALTGGRIDDVRGVVERIASTPPSEIDKAIHRNTWIADWGVETFLATFNDGEEIVPIVTSPIAPIRSAPYFVSLLGVALPTAVIVLIGGAVIRETRVFSVVGLMALWASLAVVAYYLMDNVRFIIVPNLFALTVATGVIAGLWSVWQQRRID